ncbi:histidine kinase [Actinotalea sp. AC32]|nr:histidine kinase [Actinotalea sp. AC32]
MRVGRGSPVVAMLVVGLVATAAVLGLPFLGFAYRAPAVHVAVETANAVVALFVAYLIHARFRHTRRVQELLLVLALAAVAVANLLLTAVPSAVAPDAAELVRWAPLGIRLVGTVLLASAAWWPPDRTVGRRGATVTVGALVVLGLAITAGGLAWASALPPTVDPTVALDDSSRPLLVAHPVVTGVQALSVLLYGVAALAFLRQARRHDDELLQWVAAGCVLAAFARVHYVLFPSLYSEYLYTGDLLRLGFYLCLLVGAAREVDSFWQWRAEVAVLEERRRMARDLHDGLAQELAYVWSRSRALAARTGDDDAERIGGAAARALDEARRAIAALSRPLDEPFATVLRQVGDELAARYDVKVVVEADEGAPDPAAGEDVLRIVAEAVRNAARHGHAARVHVAFEPVPLRLVVTDDGVGFDPREAAARRAPGFGLTSMRERAAALGADLLVSSGPGDGARVEVRQR